MPNLKIGRRKAMILASAALFVIAAVGGGAFLLLSGGQEIQYKTQSALRKALPVTAAAELHKHGVRLGAPLRCADLPGWTKKRMRVACTGMTADRKPVQVIGTGEQEKRRNYYTILVDGRPVVENASCLGADCVKKDD
ncbi:MULTISPECIES: hypothetical protein [unclassified Actinomadura]|uniref:hypothetical protein n=1 Tax=unclassified Actinomadura TaxID=2626254 RepID=UPI0011EC9EE5|nr:hypothetical protein [Actinomadura sp. K4S16]